MKWRGVHSQYIQVTIFFDLLGWSMRCIATDHRGELFRCAVIFVRNCIRAGALTPFRSFMLHCAAVPVQLDDYTRLLLLLRFYHNYTHNTGNMWLAPRPLSTLLPQLVRYFAR